MMGFIIFITQR